MAGGIGLQQGINSIIGQATQGFAIAKAINTQEKLIKKFTEDTVKEREALNKTYQKNPEYFDINNLKSMTDKLKQINEQEKNKPVNLDNPQIKENRRLLSELMKLKPENPVNHPIEQRQQEIEKRKTGKSFIIDTINLYHQGHEYTYKGVDYTTKKRGE